MYIVPILLGKIERKKKRRRHRAKLLREARKICRVLRLNPGLAYVLRDRKIVAERNP